MPVLKLDDKALLAVILRFAKIKKIKLYIVGGFLRDLYLGREKPNPDIDFALKNNALKFGRALAKEIRAGFVVLDREHGACRVVKKIKNKVYTLDFTDFRGPGLEQDLLHRDFTINTLSIELEKALRATAPLDFILDLYGARKDLEARTIRIANNKAFNEDPLRILRCFSLSAIFGFAIDKATLKLIRLKRDKLATVSYERIRDEVFKILHCPNSHEYLSMMDELKVLKVILPEIEIMRGVKQGPYHHLDVLKHSFEAVKQLESAITACKNNPDMQNYLQEIISSGRRRLALIKLAALLHDIGKPRAKRRKKGRTLFHGHEGIGARISIDIAKRLKLSNEEINALRKMVFWHLRPGYLADNPEVTPRAIFRYFRDTAREGVSTLLLSIGDQRATKGRLTSRQSRLQHEKVVFGLIKRYFRLQKEKKLPRLINGDDLIAKFKLEPSPLIGKILAEIEELHAIGEIKTKPEALRKARLIINKSRKQTCPTS